MSQLNASSFLFSRTAGFYDHEIEQSLRFNDNDNAYLSRTPSTGNRKTWTFSCWVKRGNIKQAHLLTAYTSSSDTTNIAFGITEGNLQWYDYISGYRIQLSANALFRDVSAWYHLVFALDTTQATASDRAKIWVNGERVTSFYEETYPSQNADLKMNTAIEHRIGDTAQFAREFDGYLADVNFIDGQALDPTSFGEIKSGIWIPKDTADLTFGTNGFRLQFGDTTEASGFNTLTWTGTGQSQALTGLGFSPDLIWQKSRNASDNYFIVDSVRGVNQGLSSNSTATEVTSGASNDMVSFDADGFTTGVPQNYSSAGSNGYNIVSWAWDAGSGSPASNTDGDITSTVKANTDYGFSIVTYSGNSTGSQTVGHGLGEALDCVIVKARSGGAGNWAFSHTAYADTSLLTLDTTQALSTGAGTRLQRTTSTSTFLVGDSADFTMTNASGWTYVAYCFAEKAGYSKFGTYTGTGAAGNSITLGFKPAFLLIKETGNANSWELFDNTRNTSSPFDKRLFPNDGQTEATTTSLSYSDTGFETLNGNTGINRSGGTYIYMAFADTRDAAFWKDTSGQGNDFQPNNLVFSDVVPDSTTNNFGTWNPLVRTTGYTFSEGNLKALAGTSDYGTAGTMFTPKTGKWYFEFCNSANGGTSGRKVCGVASSQIVAGNDKYDTSIANGIEWSPTGGTAAIYAFRENGDKCSISATTAYGSDDAQTVGDVVGVALDLDNSAIYFSVNGVWQNSGDPTSGASQTGAAFTSLADDNYTIMMHQWDTSHAWTHNGGQDSTFANLRAAGGNADENGYGDFAYAPPSGFLSLCSLNLPTGAIDTLNDETPEDYFNTLLWTGNGGTQSITGVNFQPSLTWIKSRSAAYDHVLTDAVRGVEKQIISNKTDAESQDAGKGLTSFDSDGFTVTLGTSTSYNNSSQTYAAWNWKANGSGVSNTDGSVTSTVSVGATSQQNWFSIVTWTGTSGSDTIGHGLGTAPELIITKSLSGDNWIVYHEAMGATKQVYLDLTNAQETNANIYSAVPTSSVFTIGSWSSTRNFVSYCFASAEGLCKVGKYGAGTGDSDGPFVYTGFRPAFILAKRYDGAVSWPIWDNKRDGINQTEKYLLPNLSNAESSAASTGVDFLSNGFKFRGGSAIGNLSGGNYIYLAIAEQPFKYANAR
jgi:hypothetical protein